MKQNIVIVGIGRIAARVAKGIEASRDGRLYGVVSRNIISAFDFVSQKEGVEVFANYEAALADEHVDVVYLCVPNAQHFPYIIQALKANKHVLCEKPMLLNQKQLQQCFALAKKQSVFLMECHKGLCLPLIDEIEQILAQGGIGELSHIEASYGARLLEPNTHWLWDAQSGGCHFDLGVYAVAFAHYLTKSKPEQNRIQYKQNPQGCVVGYQVMVRYENGITAHLASSFESQRDNRAVLYGSQGRIEIDRFWKHTQARWYQGEVLQLVEVSQANDFTPEIDHALDCIAAGLIESPRISQEMSREILKTIKG
ncbi:MAG: Gfo/Idh/MocA family protein [Erysipelotrichaceae bacterium]